MQILNMAGTAVRSKTIAIAKSFSTIQDLDIVDKRRYILSVTVTEEERSFGEWKTESTLRVLLKL